MAKRTARRRSTGSVGSAALGRVRPGGSQSAPTTPEQLAEQYRYVINDLERIGLIAVGLIAGLVALSFFLK